jgi:hypothetical protein
VVLQQAHNDDLVHPAHFKSGIWSDIELRYDAMKLECKELLKALKKFQFWIYGRTFIMQMDTQTLVWLLNQPLNDLPTAFLTRWLSYIHLFDFQVKHVRGKRNGAAQGVSQRGFSSFNSLDNDDIDTFFDSSLYAVSTLSLTPSLDHV